MARSRPSVLCGEPENFSAAGLAAIGAFCELDARPLETDEFERIAPQYDVLMVRLQHRIDPALAERARRLEAILSPTTGLNHLALEQLESRGVRVFHLRGETAFLQTITSTAEHTMALLLALLRRVPAAFDAVKNGRWEQRPFRGHELKGQRLGILGYGRLGRMVARYAGAFGMNVAVYDPAPVHVPDGIRRCASMDELLRDSDVLSIHVPLNRQTEGLLDARELALLPRGAVIVNTSRGEIVVESALLELLDQGHLGGYATDVLSQEHRIETLGHALITYAREAENVLITPHIGGAAWEAIEQTDLFIAGRFRRWWEGEHGDR